MCLLCGVLWYTLAMRVSTHNLEAFLNLFLIGLAIPTLACIHIDDFQQLERFGVSRRPALFPESMLFSEVIFGAPLVVG